MKNLSAFTVKYTFDFLMTRPCIIQLNTYPKEKSNERPVRNTTELEYHNLTITRSRNHCWLSEKGASKLVLAGLTKSVYHKQGKSLASSLCD